MSRVKYNNLLNSSFNFLPSFKEIIFEFKSSLLKGSAFKKVLLSNSVPVPSSVAEWSSYNHLRYQVFFAPVSIQSFLLHLKSLDHMINLVTVFGNLNHPTSLQLLTMSKRKGLSKVCLLELQSFLVVLNAVADQV